MNSDGHPQGSSGALRARPPGPTSAVAVSTVCCRVITDPVRKESVAATASRKPPKLNRSSGGCCCMYIVELRSTEGLENTDKEAGIERNRSKEAF